MEHETKRGRRELLTRALLVGTAAAVSSSLLEACGGSSLTCTDTAGLSGDEMTARSTNGYVDKSPDAAKACSKCNFFQGKGENACGGCMVLKGPINPAGSCKLWVLKA